MDRPLPWLRYVAADDVDDQDVGFDGLKVRNDAGEKLGEVDGFVVDADSGRPYYVVVDSGGWFRSKEFLLPIGHVRLDGDRDALVADLTKERINRFPGFDKKKFERLSEDELRRMNDEICTACSVTVVSYSATAPLSTAWERSDYAQPEWWRSGSSVGQSSDSSAKALRNDPEFPRRESERITARERDDSSPHPGGRAQPGDVIGVETGGERTYVGDTSEEENKRRRDAEDAVRNPREK